MLKAVGPASPLPLPCGTGTSRTSRNSTGSQHVSSLLPPTRACAYVHTPLLDAARLILACSSQCLRMSANVPCDEYDIAACAELHNLAAKRKHEGALFGRQNLHVLTLTSVGTCSIRNRYAFGERGVRARHWLQVAPAAQVAAADLPARLPQLLEPRARRVAELERWP